MSRGPCLCGDTECPWCGGAQGTYTGSDPGEPLTECEVCEAPLKDQEFATGLCAKCLAEAKTLIRGEG